MTGSETVYIVGGDGEAMAELFSSIGLESRVFAQSEQFLFSLVPDAPACVVSEMRMPGMSGLELLARVSVPVIIVAARADVAGAVEAMKAGAVEFFERPVNSDVLLRCVQYWMRQHRQELVRLATRAATRERLRRLSRREREVLNGVLNGMTNSEIAAELGISSKAIDLYRGNMMRKIEVSSHAALFRTVLSEELQSDVPPWRPALGR